MQWWRRDWRQRGKDVLCVSKNESMSREVTAGYWLAGWSTRGWLVEPLSLAGG